MVKISKGFTLAEVLITLGIIGVVAAMTLPLIILNYQKQECVSKLKKSYTNLQSALQMSIAENGDISGWEYSDKDDFFNKYIAPYYKKVKNYRNYSGIFYSIDGKFCGGSPNWVALSDGTSVGIGHLYSNCIYIYIDINSEKEPNRLGKDIFLLVIHFKNNQLRFLGQGYTNEQLKSDYNGGGYQCIKGTNTQYAGGKCGAKIMQDGWQISDDYPW